MAISFSPIQPGRAFIVRDDKTNIGSVWKSGWIFWSGTRYPKGVAVRAVSRKGAAAKLAALPPPARGT